MANKKPKKFQFMPLPDGFEASAFAPKGKRITVKPTGLHATWDWQRIYINYAGEDAAEALCLMELPNDSDVIRQIAEGFKELADKLDA